MPSKPHQASEHNTLSLLQQQTWMDDIAPFVPINYQEKAHEMQAFVRARKLRTVDDLLRSLFCWAFAGLSLRQLGIWATVLGIGSLSDRAWSRRLTKTHAWVLWLVSHMLGTGPVCPVLSQRRLRIVDASNIRARQTNGHFIRLHTSYLLNEQRIDEIVVTTEQTHESLALLTWQAGDIVIADRGYCRHQQLAYITQAHADLIVRWHSLHAPLHTRQGDPLNVTQWVQSLTDAQAECEVAAGTHPLRLIACRLSPQAAQRARRRCHRKAQKAGHLPKEQTILLANWLLLLTSLPAEEATTHQILEVYRARWQVELLFKRIKQLLQVHRLPSFREHTNAALVGIILCGWLVMEAHLHRLMESLPQIPVSLWQCQSALMRAFRQQIVGMWSLSLVMRHWPILQRYLRPSRPVAKRWSHQHLFDSLDAVLGAA
jgi:hypothetical protein